MRFPPFDDRGTLTTTELEALRSLHGAFLTAQYEWQSAVVLWDRLESAHSLADLRAADRSPFRHHGEALHAINRGASDYERHTALITWRYAASAAVLGITVLERMARAKPPLTATTVEELCKEPTLGRLREETARRWAALREGVDTAIGTVVEIAEFQGAAYPRTRMEAADCLMTEHSPSYTDPAYLGILEPLLVVAEEVPYGISRVVVGR
ncbi:MULTISPECIES: hypothetical protein [unclassified Streptomyces]|uniref:hypothetical protein n=1 Tax=unclassified Streptomyces TaxID=2593676 RepID=UPI000DDC0738|nr:MULTISPECIES: hypothetical protein [unclassified Streptomyces]QZZ24926.1 hypothetical protein A7X85_00095 [Streptomyces sp. ST1015]